MTKNDRVWKILFEEEHILAQIEQNDMIERETTVD